MMFLFLLPSYSAGASTNAELEMITTPHQYGKQKQGYESEIFQPQNNKATD